MLATFIYVPLLLSQNYNCKWDDFIFTGMAARERANQYVYLFFRGKVEGTNKEQVPASPSMVQDPNIGLL